MARLTDSHVVCPDGSHRAFHQSNRSGGGHVLVGRVRVYGHLGDRVAIAPCGDITSLRSFVPSTRTKHAALVASIAA